MQHEPKGVDDDSTRDRGNREPVIYYLSVLWILLRAIL